jgi:Ni,Fe-hydrogenase I cytochrome b subunit
VATLKPFVLARLRRIQTEQKGRLSDMRSIQAWRLGRRYDRQFVHVLLLWLFRAFVRQHPITTKVGRPHGRQGSRKTMRRLVLAAAGYC